MTHEFIAIFDTFRKKFNYPLREAFLSAKNIYELIEVDGWDLNETLFYINRLSKRRPV